MKFIKIKIRNKILNVKDCKGLLSLIGLMFDDMRNHDGALIYGNSVWMPFVKHKLKLIFLDDDLKIIDIQNSIPLSSNYKSWRIYYSTDAKYCLETNREINVRKGDNARII